MTPNEMEARRAAVRKSPFRIFVDQAGYFPTAEKKAVMSFPCEEFAIVDEKGEVRYKGQAKRFGFDQTSGDTVYTADFSDFAENGWFRVTAGEERSAAFEIGADVYGRLLNETVKALYFLRCGCGLDEQYAGRFKHGKCHTGMAVLLEDGKTELDVTGGWHDAGDYGRYVTPGACAAAHLLYAYQLFPDVFAARKFGIPESGIPDVLAECREELLWLKKMQRPDGGAYHKVTTMCHAPFVMPEDDRDQLYVFPVSSMATADLAAICALAARVYEPFDKPLAAQLAAVARRSCDWLDENPQFIGFENPEGCNTGGYEQTDDHSNRFWAYAELYALTGEEKYHERMKAALTEKFPLTAFGYAETGGFGMLTYLLCGRAGDAALKERFAEAFRAEAQRLKAVADQCGYGCAMEETDYIWGSNMELLKYGMVFAVNDMLAGTEEFREYAAAQIHYLMGVNALGISYVTGNGEFRCNYPHLRPAHADGIEECIPGMVAGGPNRVPADPDALILIPAGTPPMKCYADEVWCYSLNEITIYWNSPAIFILAYLCRERNK